MAKMTNGPYDDSSLSRSEFYDGPSPHPGYPWARHSGDCGLLTGYCASTRYTLIDGGPTAFYAPFVGCNNDKQECCPFMPKTAFGTSGASQTVYPQPQNSKGAVLDSCPQDYYSISGSCCPSAYTPWTAQLGGATPCASTVTATGSTTAAPLTGIANRAAATQPTVTVTDTVFAMQYALADPGSAGLSHGEVAGIAVGSAAGLAFLLLGLGFFIRKHLQKRRKIAHAKSELHYNGDFYDTGASELPTYTHPRLTGSDSAKLTKKYYELPAEPSNKDPPAYRPHDSYLNSLRRQNAVKFTAKRPWWPIWRSMHLQRPADDDARYVHELPRVNGRAPPPAPLDLPAAAAASPEDVHLARWERLSRGHPKVVYTPGQGSLSSEQGQLEGDASSVVSFPAAAKQYYGAGSGEW